jgi:hypothetical protein
MKRIIVDYKKLTPEILNLLVEKFPDGYGIRDIVKFTNQNGHYIEAVEVSTEDTKYLVKISDELVDSMESYDEEEDDDIIPTEGDLDIDLDKDVLEIEDEDDDIDNDSDEEDNDEEDNDEDDLENEDEEEI